MANLIRMAFPGLVGPLPGRVMDRAAIDREMRRLDRRIVVARSLIVSICCAFGCGAVLQSVGAMGVS